MRKQKRPKTGEEDGEISVENPVLALQEFLRTEPPALTLEEAEELDRIIWEERNRGMADFENPLTRKPR
jgi:hypothetical protein